LNGRYISGSNLKGENGESIREKINVDHFKDGDEEIDVCVDCDGGIMRIKRIGYSENINHEIMINGINKCTDNHHNAWIPHFIWDWRKDNGIKISIAKINPSYYGKGRNIAW